jgi:MFS family permease
MRLRLCALVMLLVGSILNATVGAFPGVINTVLGVESSGVNTGILIGAAVSAAIYPLIGLLSQKFGRRPTIAVIGLVNLAPACALYYILVAGAYRDPTSLVALVASIVVLSLPIWAVHTPYLAVGNGLSYALGVAAARWQGREGKIVLFEGDGGLLFHIQELETLKRQGFRILIYTAASCQQETPRIAANGTLIRSPCRRARAPGREC